MDTFQALVARQDGDRITASVETLRPDDPPPGDVTIRVHYSSVNFKDALALSPAVSERK
jgi:acrylyl-CoA reductase (NADPH)